MVQTCSLHFHIIALLLFRVLFADIVLDTGKWELWDYPNPLLAPQNCSRVNPSYVCDPDGILAEGQADQLDFILARIRNTTMCICKDCKHTDPGITVAIALMESIANTSDSNITDFANYLRDDWNFGQCGDDVILIVSSADQQSHAAIGPAVYSVIPEELAVTIFQSSKNHFSNGYYYQGLESIVESYYDVLRKLQNSPKSNSSSANGKDITIALVVSVVTLVALVVFLAILMYRMKKASRKMEAGTNLTRWHTSQQTKSSIEDYERCSTDSHNEDCDSMDESGDDFDGSLYDVYQMYRIQGITKRQLSAVLEESENEDDDDGKEERNRSSSINQKSSVNGVPRIPRFQ